MLAIVVVVPTKVIKFLLITTSPSLCKIKLSCCCTYKGNQIFANHNVRLALSTLARLLLYLQR